MSNKRRQKRKSKVLASRIALRLRVEVHNELRRRAAAEHRSLSNYVHRIIDAFLSPPQAVGAAVNATPVEGLSAAAKAA